MFQACLRNSKKAVWPEQSKYEERGEEFRNARPKGRKRFGFFFLSEILNLLEGSYAEDSCD